MLPENVWVWLGIGLCLSQSAMFSGLNLAMFSLSRMGLEIDSSRNNRKAQRVLSLRRDANFLLTTILWGNVGVNVLLTMLSESVLAGVSAFFFSTVVITIAGEIAPQAVFSRYALHTAAFFCPVMRVYQVLLYPVAKPTALILELLVGPESIHYYTERDFREVIKAHVLSPRSDIDDVEGIGALNFLALDDVPVSRAGEPLDPASVIRLPCAGNRPVFPSIDRRPDDPLLQQIEASGKKWVIVVDERDEPRAVINADGFLRNALLGGSSFNPHWHCHRPIVIRDPRTPLGETIQRLKVHPERSGDDVIDDDIVLFWGQEKRVITGADILGRLLRGIVPVVR